MKGSFSGVWGQKGKSPKQVPSDSSGPQLLGRTWGASVYLDSPRPLAPATPLQTASTYGHKPRRLSEKHVVSFPGPEALEGPRPRLRLFGQDVAGQGSIGGCSANFGSSATRASQPGPSAPPLFMFTLEAESTFRISPADESPPDLALCGGC